MKTEFENECNHVFVEYKQCCYCGAFDNEKEIIEKRIQSNVEELRQAFSEWYFGCKETNGGYPPVAMQIFFWFEQKIDLHSTLTSKTIIDLKEKERQSWAEMCIKKQAIIESALPGGWIELKEGNALPDYDEPALWLSEDGLMHVDALDKDGNPHIFEGYRLFEDGPFIKTTHWRPLPNIPDENTNK